MKFQMPLWAIAGVLAGVAAGWVMNLSGGVNAEACNSTHKGFPQDPEGRYIIFPEDEFEPEPGDETVVVVELLTVESARSSLAILSKSSNSYEHMFKVILCESTLGRFDESNGNPYIFLGEGAATLPDNAVIEWSIGKERLAEVFPADWESAVLGPQIAMAHLDAYLSFREYQEATAVQNGSTAQADPVLAERIRAARERVVEYIQRPSC